MELGIQGRVSPFAWPEIKKSVACLSSYWDVR